MHFPTLLAFVQGGVYPKPPVQDLVESLVFAAFLFSLCISPRFAIGLVLAVFAVLVLI